MDEIIQAFLVLVSVSLYSIPNFVLIFFLKCVDLYSYKKLDAIPKMTKHVLFSLGIICIGNLTLIGVESLPIFISGMWLLVGSVLGLILVPAMTKLIQIVLYLVERKLVNDKYGKVRPITLSFLVNIAMSMLYNVLYYFVMQHNMHGPAISFDTDEGGSFTMDHFDIIIGAILLLVIFVVVKIVIQAILVRIAKKKKEQQQLPEEA